MASMSCKHSKKGVFVRTTWKVIVPNGVGIRTTPLIVAVPLLNRIVLFLAADISISTVGSSFYSAKTYCSPTDEIPTAPLSGMIPWNSSAEY
jgi:hypothetical protein